MKKLTTLFLLLTILNFAPISSAQGFTISPPGGIGVGDTPNINNTSTSAEKLVENIVINVVNLFFTIGGIGVIIYFVWGAVDWILSGGDKEKIAAARKKMTHAIIGLVLLSLSFFLINLIGQVVGFNPLGNLQLPYLGTGIPGT